jgi:hypothetical protein
VNTESQKSDFLNLDKLFFFRFGRSMPLFLFIFLYFITFIQYNHPITFIQYTRRGLSMDKLFRTIIVNFYWACDKYLAHSI